MNRSESIKELAGALAKAQAVMKGATKDAENPHFRSKYADLASVWEACREALTANGLSVLQAPRAVAGGVEVETMLMHVSGEWISESLSIPVSKSDAQGFGSALTYCRRYGLSAMVGIAPEDDDGNAAAKATPANGEFKPIPARGGMREKLSPEDLAEVDRLSGLVLDAFEVSDEALAYSNYVAGQRMFRGNEAAQVAFFDKFSSKQRAALKKLHEDARAKDMAAQYGQQG